MTHPDKAHTLFLLFLVAILRPTRHWACRHQTSILDSDAPAIARMELRQSKGDNLEQEGRRTTTNDKVAYENSQPHDKIQGLKEINNFQAILMLKGCDIKANEQFKRQLTDI